MVARKPSELKPLYVAATGEHAGKSAIALGLCLAMRQRGIDAGYFKPLGFNTAGRAGSPADADALQAAEVLGLKDDPADLCPLVVSEQLTDDVISGRREVGVTKLVADAFHRVAAGRDLVVVEGLGALDRGSFLDAGGPRVAALLEARTLLVDRYADTESLDRLVAARSRLETQPAGAIINFVPRGRLEEVEGAWRPFLKARELELFGVIRADARLSAVTVAAISARLEAEFLCAEEAAGRSARELLIGAMNQEHALRYFQRVAEKVVITGGDRADIIMAALETPTVAVVLTGNLRPASSVVGRAEELGIPLLLTGFDTLTAARRVQELFGRARLQEESQLKLVTSLIDEYVDLDRLVGVMAAA